MAELARKLSSRKAGYAQHGDLREHALMGNHIVGWATQALGAREIEVWHSLVEPGAATPVHSHNAEEVILVLKGRGEARRNGEETIEFEAPCTLILPANELHQMANTGTDEFESIAILPIGSKIFDEKGVEMALPWRE